MPFFNPRFKFPIHILQIFLVLLALGGTAVRLLIVKAPAGAPPSRANTMALGMVRTGFFSYSHTFPCQPPSSLTPSHEMEKADNASQGARSLIIIAYIMLSEKYQKWNSLKAYMILNSLEVVSGVPSHF